jgi:FkbM family methyltransferase
MRAMGWRTADVVTVEATFGTIRAYDGDLITQQIQDFGAHTRPELAFLSHLILPGDRVFDMGAHIGTFTIPMAQRVGATGTVVAVEADAMNFALLKENLAANGLSDRVRAFHAILSPDEGQYAVRVDEKNSGATHVLSDQNGERSRTLDEFARMSVVPDILKIDIEGLEPAVLMASQMVRKFRPVIYTEVLARHMARYGTDIGTFDRFLSGLGYRLFRNVDDRNAAHDRFTAVEIDRLSDIGTVYDVLAVPADSARLERIAPQK